MRTTGIEFGGLGEAHLCGLGDPPSLKPTEILVATEYAGITNDTERHALNGEHG